MESSWRLFAAERGLTWLCETYSLPRVPVRLAARLLALPPDTYLTDYPLSSVSALAVVIRPGAGIEIGAFGVSKVPGHPHFPYGLAVAPD